MHPRGRGVPAAGHQSDEAFARERSRSLPLVIAVREGRLRPPPYVIGPGVICH